ncbi:hypothetical protein COL922a_012395 [Colletotrichum nupharicola]|nr:hypothetical protein COL922a_012395 [Colletotrichum nupharicola]
MASVTAQRVPGDMAGDNRDVADLWKDSLKAYKSIVGFDLEHKFESVEAMITQGTKEMQNFHKFRQDDTAFDDQKREQSKQRGSGEQKGKSSAAEYGRHPSAKGIRNTLMEVEGEDHEYHVLQETIMLDTCAWVFREPEWERWLNQQDPPDTVLAITGSLARKSEEATKDSSRRTCVSQFYFREQNESLSSFTNGVISVINQVAEQSPELCEAM